MANIKSLKIHKDLGNGIKSFLIQDTDSGLVYSVCSRNIQAALASLKKYLNGLNSGGNIHCKGK